ncbi:MAG: hypothetical protein F4Y63_00685 [Chloroflexi bacterium]|nr:hypothetical protein [Chloroflexota bacterium]MYK60783.1 hypothetical protein [Chloroflexota bacterium]
MRKRRRRQPRTSWWGFLEAPVNSEKGWVSAFKNFNEDRNRLARSKQFRESQDKAYERLSETAKQRRIKEAMSKLQQRAIEEHPREGGE